MKLDLGLGAATQPGNVYAGTYDDINCPTRCWVAGNGLDMSIFGNTCWPCHNVCPPGTVWDTSALQCSANPGTPNPVLPTTVNDQPPPAPPDCSSWWSQQFNSQCGGSGTLLVIAGAAIIGLAVFGFTKGR